MPRPKGSKNRTPEERAANPKPSYYVPTGRPRGRPKKTAEEIAEKDATVEKMYAERKARQKELVIKHAAELMAQEEALQEDELRYPEVQKARAKWKIDKEKLQTHNQYITAIASMPFIDNMNPAEVQDRMLYYIDVATAAGQRIVFETCALALGLSREALKARINGTVRMTQELRNTYIWVRGLLDSATAEYAHSGESNAISTIFFARNNQGYSNEDSKATVDNTDSASEQSNEEIAKKYADLPL